jgi:hypothetical protein
VNPEPTSEKSLATTDEKVVARPAPKSPARIRAVDKIRSELNVEKWPAIWQPAKSKNKPALRVMERESFAADGGRVVSRVEVGYTQLGTLSTEEQKMLYVLIKLWEENGKPDTQVFFSSRGLARMLKKKGWGTNVIHAITKSLRKLRTIPIEWINSYYDQTKQGAVVVDRRPFTLLGELRIVERHQDGAVNNSQGYFKFDDHVLTNLQLNYTKPVCIEEFFKLKSEIAQLIYSHIDLMLYDKTRYERRSKELFEDLGLKNAEYSHMYERKRAIEKALKGLNGIRLSSGVLKSATVEKTVDGKDYKVGFSKGTVAALVISATEKLPEAPKPGVIINDYSKGKDALTVAAEDLVRLFYKNFHGVDKHEPQSRETNQALSLISQHGLEKATHLLQFAQKAAAETQFKPQTFGGVLQYTSRAVFDFERSRSAVPLRRAGAERRTPDPQPTSQQWQKGERRFGALTVKQRKARFEQAKDDVFRENPFLKQHWKEDNSLHQQMVRNRLIRKLDLEVMELTPTGFYDCLPSMLRPVSLKALEVEKPAA